MENVLTVLLIIFIIALIVLIVLIVYSLYNFIMRKIYTPEKLLVSLLEAEMSNIIYINIKHANFSYAMGERVYALLGDKYLYVNVNSDVNLTVSTEPLAFYHQHVDALLSYVSLYTDKPVKANYPEK